MRRLTMTRCIQAGVIAALATSSSSLHAAEPAATIVEYFNSTSNKYFISANPADWALLDQYASIGWKRTGVTFSAYTQGQDGAAKPVYRFFAPAVGSHFFTLSEADRVLLSNTAGFNYEGVAWYAQDQLQTLVATINPCATGTTALYRAFNNGSSAPANHRYFEDYGFYQSYADKGYALEGVAMCLPLSTSEKRSDASRLLYQAGFGARPGDIDIVVNRGVNGWLDDQFAATGSQYTPRDWWPLNRPDTCVNNTTPPLTDSSYCQRDNYSLFQPQREFFKHAINNGDQLRQRVAWTWSQLFVTSGTDVGMPYGMIDYQQMLRDEAFSNFRNLLQKVTLHAAMGRYLDMVNNLKPANGVAPNENYAREVLQLFSVGLYQLNNDGTYKRGAKGELLDTYSQDDVENLAHVFTGWTYPTVPGNTPATLNRVANTKGAMEERGAQHDYSTQAFMNGTIAGSQTQGQRLNAALDIIFNHPNVPPFVSKFLIQQWVTGQPSTAYVDRVARVFQNNGSGVRGDMKAVIRAVLTDPEARGPAKWNPTFGHQAEPVLAITRLARAMNAQTDGVFFRTTTGNSGQTVFVSPSVFNYYPPDYALSTSGVLAPEFAIYNTTSALNRVNVAYGTVFGTINPDATVFGATGTQFDLSAYTAVAADSNALLDRINDVLFAGRLTSTTRTKIKTAVDAVATTDPVARARTALYLASAAPETQVLR
ncbi:MAG: DUF1800 domain-containing protein [Burkholderiales bacterium]|nr:DUF1800 domain-containing protein [Burkholderiales bacterium]